MAEMTEEPKVSETDGLDMSDPRIKEIAEANGLSAEPDSVKPEGEPKSGAEETVSDTTKPEVTDNAEERKPKYSNREVKRLQYQNKQLLNRLAEIEKKIGEANQQVQKPAPKREQFATEAEYTEAVVDRRIAERDAKRLEAEQESLNQQRETETLRSSWEEKIQRNFSTPEEQEEYRQALEDLGHPAEVLDARINGYIFKSPVGPKMLKYLSERPSVIPTLREMHDWDLSDALKKISAYVGKSPAKAQTPAKPTSAPAPIGKLGGGGGSQKSPDEMSDAELMASYRSGSLKL